MPPKEYEIITAIVVAIIVFLLAGFFILVLVVNYNQRQRKHMLEKQSIQSKFHETLLQTQLEIQEQVFKTISQEIHDNIGQTLSFIKLNLNTITIPNDSSTEQKLASSKVLLTKVIQDLRDLSKLLNADFINETGLVDAIEQQLNILQKSGMYSATLTVKNDTEKFAPEQELVLYRIVQELLNNIVKHADGNEVLIIIVYYYDRLVITVRDNGKGFIVAGRYSGLGLHSMHDRVKMINGTLHITSNLGEGTTATIELPKHQNI